MNTFPSVPRKKKIFPIFDFLFINFLCYLVEILLRLGNYEINSKKVV